MGGPEEGRVVPKRRGYRIGRGASAVGRRRERVQARARVVETKTRYETLKLAYYTALAGERTYHIIEAGVHDASMPTRASSAGAPSHDADHLRVHAYGWRDGRECVRTAGAVALFFGLAG
jgi:hypothetical protein